MLNHRKTSLFATLLLLWGCLLPTDAVVVVPVWDTPYTQDGITIECHYGTVTITSSDRNIVMVALKRFYHDNDYYNDDNEGACNVFRNDDHPSEHSDYSDYSEYSDNSNNSDNWQAWRYTVKDISGQGEHPIIGYDVWAGETTQLIFTTTLSEGDEIVVYQDIDELPQKTPFAMYEYDEYEHWSDVNFCYHHLLTIHYGYLDFLPEKYGMGAEYYAGYNYVRIEKYPFYVDGRSQTWADKLKDLEISFDESFADFRPTSSNKWFCGVNLSAISFDHIDLSEMLDMSYMFEDCTIDEMNMNGLSFSNHPKVTGMFSGCDIQHLSLADNTTDANDDIFEGLGTSDNPCEIDAPVGLLFDCDVTQPYFQWKGGFFKNTVIIFADNRHDDKSL